jgi:hypothetical protein
MFSFFEPIPADSSAATCRRWRLYEVASGHDVMLDIPDRLTNILEELA